MTWAVCLHCLKIPGTKRNKATDETLIHVSPFSIHHKGLHGRIFCFSFEKSHFVHENVCWCQLKRDVWLCGYTSPQEFPSCISICHLTHLFFRFFFCFLKLTHTYCLLILEGLSYSKACARMWKRDCVFGGAEEWMFEMHMTDREEGLEAGDHPLQHGDDRRALFGPGWALHAELLVRALLLVEKIGAKDGGQVQGRHLISCDLFWFFGGFLEGHRKCCFVNYLSAKQQE